MLRLFFALVLVGGNLLGTSNGRVTNSNRNFNINDLCNPSPCGQNAICKANGDQVTCSCPPSSTGDPERKCEGKNLPHVVPIDRCNPSPCGVNAICTIIDDFPTCTCPFFTTGDPEINCTAGAAVAAIPLECLNKFEFQCETRDSSNKVKCVPIAGLCDGIQDCHDGSDEKDYLCPEFYSKCGVQDAVGSCATLDTNCPPHIEKHDSKSLTSVRIIGGEEAPIKAWPWMALVAFYDAAGLFKFQCGGSLITDRHVMTAAHCVNNSRNQYVVRLGEHDLSKSKDCYSANINYFDSCIPAGIMQEISVFEIHMHPEYDRHCKAKCNDIAILELGAKVTMDDKYVHPICLPRNLKRDIGFNIEELSNINIAKTGIVAGWGVTQPGGKNRSDILMQVKLQIGDDTRNCKNLVTERLNYPQRNSVFCAGDCSSGHPCKDTCTGDSGGPLMMSDIYNRKWFLVGITHAGPNPCGTDNHARYTMVAHFINWIIGILSPL